MSQAGKPSFQAVFKLKEHKKHSVLYNEDSTQDAVKIGGLYLKKDALQAAFGTFPNGVKVTVEML